MELKEKIAKALFESSNLYTGNIRWEQLPKDNPYRKGYLKDSKVILPIIEEQVAEAVKAERKRMLKKIWKIGEGVDTEAVIEEVNTWCCEMEF